MARTSRSSGSIDAPPSSNVPYREERLREMPSDLAIRLMQSVYGLDEGAAVTALDLPGTPSMTREQIRTSIAKFLDEDEANLNQPQVIDRINAALRDGYRYMTVQQRFEPHMMPELKPMHSLEDLIDLVETTRLFRKDEKRGSRRELEIVMNCGLLTAAYGAFELDKKEFRQLRAKTEYVEEFLTTQEEERAPLFFPREGKTDDRGGKVVAIQGIPGVTGFLHARWKKDLRGIGKLIRDPLASQEEAMKDGIGMRLEVPRDHVGTAMLQVIDHLHKHLGATRIEVEDRNMFVNAPDAFTDLKTNIENMVPEGSILSIKQKARPGRFRVLKVSADIMVPRDPSNPNSPRAPQRIEFQIVDTGNRNDAGMENHEVYELFQTFAEERSRIMGGVSIPQFKKFAADIKIKGAPEVDTIIDGLERRGLIFKLPGTPQKYGSVGLWRRWVDVKGLLEPDIADLVRGRLPKEEASEEPDTDQEGY